MLSFRKPEPGQNGLGHAIVAPARRSRNGRIDGAHAVVERVEEAAPVQALHHVRGDVANKVVVRVDERVRVFARREFEPECVLEVQVLILGGDEVTKVVEALCWVDEGELLLREVDGRTRGIRAKRLHPDGDVRVAVSEEVLQIRCDLRVRPSVHWTSEGAV